MFLTFYIVVYSRTLFCSAIQGEISRSFDSHGNIYVMPGNLAEMIQSVFKSTPGLNSDSPF